MKTIKKFLFGKTGKGEKLVSPSPLPKERPLDFKGYNQWCQEFKPGSRYGYKGSFYNNK